MHPARLALALALSAMAVAPAASADAALPDGWLPEALCPEPLEFALGGSGWGTRPYVSFGCGGEEAKVCAPTWIGAIDLLMVC